MRCHYEVLEVEMTASGDELRKAYRKLALRWHPDKNPDDAEKATAEFRNVQAAYETLSDPQERAWYDQHREQILRGGGDGRRQGDEAEDDWSGAENLMQYFTATCFTGFGDDSHGFYAVYAGIFRDLGEHEERAGANDEDHPPFGNAYAVADDVREFYAHWSAFSTSRLFSWHDKWDLRDAPNRAHRRAMEKENERERVVARRRYNETVRALVAFAKRRDPRVAALVAAQQRERDEREALQRHRQEEEKRARAAALVGIEAQHQATMAQIYGDGGNESDGGKGSRSGGASGGEENDGEKGAMDEGMCMPICVICDKAFKSQGAFMNHERSKLHLKRLEAVRRELIAQDEEERERHGREENGEEEEEEEGEEEEEEKGEGEEEEGEEGDGQEEEEEDEGDGEEDQVVMMEGRRRKERRKKKVLGGMSDEALVGMLVGEMGLGAKKEEEKEKVEEKEGEMEEEEQQAKKKKKKLTGRKAKEARLQRREERNAVTVEVEHYGLGFTCLVCAKDFDTRNRLFQHVKEKGHATPLTTKQKGKKR